MDNLIVCRKLNDIVVALGLFIYAFQVEQIGILIDFTPNHNIHIHTFVIKSSCKLFCCCLFIRSLFDPHAQCPNPSTCQNMAKSMVIVSVIPSNCFVLALSLHLRRLRR